VSKGLYVSLQKSTLMLVECGNSLIRNHVSIDRYGCRCRPVGSLYAFHISVQLVV